MQAACVVVGDELADDAAGIFQGQRRTGTDAFFLEEAMPAFDLAVALRVVGRGLDVRHPTQTDELLEVPGDELRAVVGDDAGCDAGELLPCPLDDLLNIGLGHGFADLPVNGKAAAAIEQAAQVVERAGNVEVGDINVPVFVRTQRLHEAPTLGTGLGSVPIQTAGLLEDTVDAGGTTDGDVGVDHHEGQSAVALVEEEFLEVQDRLAFLGLQPVIAWDPGVVLVDLAVAVLPGVPLGGGQAQPQEEAGNSDAGLVGPAIDEVHDGIADVVGNPDAFQSSPRSFFSWTCSSINSERTSCLRCSFSWRAAIWRSLASASVLRRLSLTVKAAGPFSKKVFCQR